MFKIKRFSKKNYLDAVDFVLGGLKSNGHKKSFPIAKGTEFIENEFYKCAVTDRHAELLGCFCDKKLIGVLSYFCYKDEKQLQTTCLFALNQDENVIAYFVKYLRHKHHKWQILLGIEFSYREASDALKKLGFELTEDAMTYEQDVSSETSAVYKKAEEVTCVTEENLAQYLQFHREHYDFDGYYWTSSRLVESFDSFKVYVLYDKDGKIKAGTFIQKYEDGKIHEIFGLYAESKEDALKLIEGSFADIRETNPFFKTMIYFIDVDEKLQEQAVQELHFSLKSHYNCFIG